MVKTPGEYKSEDKKQTMGRAKKKKFNCSHNSKPVMVSSAPGQNLNSPEMLKPLKI